MKSSFSVKDADEEEKQQSAELNAEILEGDDDTEREKTETEHGEKENEKQVAKEEKDKQAEEGEGEEEAEDVAAVPMKKAPEGSAYFMKAGPKKLTNQFNFCERAALTYNNPFRVSSIEGYG
jgi:dynein intermediate chain 1